MHQLVLAYLHEGAVILVEDDGITLDDDITFDDIIIDDVVVGTK